MHRDSLQPVHLGQVVSSVFFVTNQSRTTRRHCLVCSTPTQDTVVGSVLFAANQPRTIRRRVLFATTPSRTSRRQCSLFSQLTQDNSSACSVCNHSIRDKSSAVFSLQPINPGQFVGGALSAAPLPRASRRQIRGSSPVTMEPIETIQVTLNDKTVTEVIACEECTTSTEFGSKSTSLGTCAIW